MVTHSTIETIEKLIFKKKSQIINFMQIIMKIIDFNDYFLNVLVSYYVYNVFDVLRCVKVWCHFYFYIEVIYGVKF